MPTLNVIADEIIGDLQRPFDVQFRERVKSILRHVFSTLIRQQLQKHGNDEQFSTHFYLDVIPKPAGPCNPDGSPSDNCWVSEFELPKPIRDGGDVPFVFVGTNDHKVSFLFTQPWEMKYANQTEAYQDKPTRYWLNNSKDLVVCDIPEQYICPDQIALTSTESPLKLTPCNKVCLHVEGSFPPGMMTPGKYKGQDAIEFHDDMVTPFPDDLIQTAKKMAFEELLILDNKVAPELTHIDNE